MLNEEGISASETPYDLRERTLRLGMRILKLCGTLPDTPEGRLVRGQLIRSGTSPGAQYREACRARSSAEFVSKIESAQQELDETDYWLELLDRAGIVSSIKLEDLKNEVCELIAIFAASARTAKTNR